MAHFTMFIVCLGIIVIDYNILHWLLKQTNTTPASEGTMAALLGSINVLVLAGALLAAYPMLDPLTAFVCGFAGGIALFSAVANFVAA